MLNVWPPPLPAVVRRLVDAGLTAWPVDGEPEVYEVADGAGRVLRVRVRGDGPADLAERVWRLFDTVVYPPGGGSPWSDRS